MSTPITLTGAYTCTHHNDKQRTECPVCLVATLRARADRAEAELSAEQDKCDKLLSVLVYADQILDDIDTCSDAHKPMYSTYSQNVFKLCIKGRDARRAAIDASVKAETK